MFDHIGKTEIIIVAVVLLILFGPKKLPEFARGLADAVKEIMNAFNGDKSEKKSSNEKKTDNKKK